MFNETYEPWTTIPYFIVLFDLLKSIAWPIAAIALAAAFSGDIRSLLRRISRLGRDGIDFQAPDQEAAEVGIAGSARLSASKPEPLSDPLLQEMENRNFASLADLKEEEVKNALVRALTLEQLRRSYALAYASIYGSQIRLLRELNVRHLTKSDVEKRYEELRDKYPIFNQWSVDQYMLFMINWNFVVEEAGFFRITETGRNFLRRLDDGRVHVKNGSWSDVFDEERREPWATWYEKMYLDYGYAGYLEMSRALRALPTSGG